MPFFVVGFKGIIPGLIKIPIVSDATMGIKSRHDVMMLEVKKN